MAAASHDPEVALLASAENREAALGEALQRHRRRLLKMVHLRLDPRLKARVDASDVLQDVYLDVGRRIDTYLEDPRMPFFLWLRFLTAQRIVAQYREHIEAQKRDVRRQAPGGMPSASTPALVDHLLAQGTTPTQNLARHERRARVRRALEGLGPDDREVLALRHFEELSNEEAAAELGVAPSAASKRHVRALRRLKEALIAAGAAESDLA
jgi:RNA polymerase sigma-70 factor (ECF subfamily)